MQFSSIMDLESEKYIQINHVKKNETKFWARESYPGNN